MPSTAERRALILVTALIALGVAARVSRATRARPEPTAAERHALDAQIARVDSARKAGHDTRLGARAKRAPPQQASLPPASDTSPGLVPRARLAPRLGVTSHTARAARSPRTTALRDTIQKPIDIDVAPASEIERLPRVGHVLAARIVANRDSCGTFGSLNALERVPGIGDGMVRLLGPMVTFSAPSRPIDAARSPGCGRAEKRAATGRRGRP